MTKAQQIEEAIQRVISGSATQYINCVNTDGETIKVRISNHKSNPTRMGDLDISLVIEDAEYDIEKDCTDVTSLSINKKSFRDIPNQYFLNENGSFVENFETIENMLDWHDIQY